MNAHLRSIAVALALVLPGLAGPSLAQSAPAPQSIDSVDASPLLKRKSYKAVIHLDVALKTFPFISPSLDGNIYYKQPDKEAVVFDTVPSLASQFKKVYPNIDPPSNWLRLFDVSTLSDENGQTTFRLVPKKNGRIEHLDVKVDDANATVKAYTWTYKDGGYVAFEQTFQTVGGNLLPDKQTGHVELPSYKADVTSAFSKYQLNVDIADSIFDDK